MFSNYGNVVPYKGQVYAKLKQKAEESGQLFRDPEFPPTEQSLFFTPGKSAGITWKRAKVCSTNLRKKYHSVFYQNN